MGEEERDFAEIQCKNCGSIWALPYFCSDGRRYTHLELRYCPLCLAEFMSEIEANEGGE